MVSEMRKSAKMPLEEVPLQFPITILCERQLGQKNRVNEIYKEIQKMPRHLKRRQAVQSNWGDLQKIFPGKFFSHSNQ